MQQQPDKTTGFDALVASLSASDMIAFGGGGLQRKPMAAAAAIARSDLSGLDVASFLGGPEVDLLIGMGKVKRLHFAFVGFDNFGLAPNFRKARQSGALEAVEYSEGLMMTAYEAAAKRLPFLPSRFGLGTDLLNTTTCVFRPFKCPITGQDLLAVPPLSPDVAIVHVNAADRSGNAVIHSDAFADLLLVQAAKRVVLTAERIVDDINEARRPRSSFITRLWVDEVIEAPKGGGFTAVFPDYRIDLPKVVDYQKNATDQTWLVREFAGA